MPTRGNDVVLVLKEVSKLESSIIPPRRSMEPRTAHGMSFFLFNTKGQRA